MTETVFFGWQWTFKKLGFAGHIYYDGVSPVEDRYEKYAEAQLIWSCTGDRLE